MGEFGDVGETVPIAVAGAGQLALQAQAGEFVFGAQLGQPLVGLPLGLLGERRGGLDAGAQGERHHRQRHHDFNQREAAR